MLIKKKKKNLILIFALDHIHTPLKSIKLDTKITTKKTKTIHNNIPTTT
jgi:hypothetical protein